MNKFVFVVDDDISQEELEETILASLPTYTDNKCRRGIINNGAVNFSAHDKEIINNKISNRLCPQFKNGVLNKISSKKILGLNSTNSWTVTPFEMQKQSTSNDLEEILQEQKNKPSCSADKQISTHSSSLVLKRKVEESLTDSERNKLVKVKRHDCVSGSLKTTNGSNNLIEEDITGNSEKLEVQQNSAQDLQNGNISSSSSSKM